MEYLCGRPFSGCSEFFSQPWPWCTSSIELYASSNEFQKKSSIQEALCRTLLPKRWTICSVTFFLRNKIIFIWNLFLNWPQLLTLVQFVSELIRYFVFRDYEKWQMGHLKWPLTKMNRPNLRTGKCEKCPQKISELFSISTKSDEWFERFNQEISNRERL